MKGMILKNKRLVFFLTHGMSLGKWKENGSFEREIAVYNYLADYFGEIIIVSYGGASELAFKELLAPNIRILYKKGRLINILYQLVIPFKYWNILSRCDFLKTNQILGSLPAIILKLFHSRIVLIARAGYVTSLNSVLYREVWFRRIYACILEWMVYRCCDNAFITTEENKDYLLKKYPFLKSKIDVIPNAIDTEIFKPIQIAKKYDIGYVGRLQKDKNLLNLLEAVKGLDVSVCFVGRGEEKERLADFVAKNNINLHLVDKVDNFKLPEILNLFRIFVFPSLHEGNPKSLLEAMSCGLPVIGCNVPGVRNVIESNKSGLMAGTDSQSLRNKISELLNNNDLRKRLGINARAFVQKNYNARMVFEREKNIYENLA